MLKICKPVISYNVFTKNYNKGFTTHLAAQVEVTHFHCWGS